MWFNLNGKEILKKDKELEKKQSTYTKENKINRNWINQVNFK